MFSKSIFINSPVIDHFSDGLRRDCPRKLPKLKRSKRSQVQPKVREHSCIARWLERTMGSSKFRLKIYYFSLPLSLSILYTHVIIHVVSSPGWVLETMSHV